MFAFRQKLGDQIIESFKVNRLSQIGVEAGVVSGLPKTGGVEGGAGDDGNVLQRFVFANLARRRHPVEVRHRDVHQDKVGARGGRGLCRFFAVHRGDDAVAHVLQRETEQHDVVADVVHDKDRRAGFLFIHYSFRLPLVRILSEADRRAIPIKGRATTSIRRGFEGVVRKRYCTPFAMIS